MEIHISRNGQQYGPYSRQQAEKHLADGNLLPHDLAWRPGCENWMPLFVLLNGVSEDVPAPRAADPIADLARDLVRAFQRKIPPVSIPFLYRFGLLIVALAMILLPIAYFALAGSVAYATYYHAVHHQAAILGSHLNVKLRLLAYGGPLLGGVIICIFMAKPIFLRRRRHSKPVSLDPVEQPLLFAFVENLCHCIGAPSPRRIDIDCDVNASAGFHRGWLSFFSNDLVLTIGMPLVSAMTLRQFAGVLAHEFGHFAQGAGMRLTYIIRCVNGWFAEVVYRRDAIDESLAELSANANSFFALLMLLIRGMVAATRGILWCFMMAGHALSCFMMRQMEYDADRYGTRLAGTQDFIETTHWIQTLSVVYRQTLRESFRPGQLSSQPSNVPALVASRAKALTEEENGRIRTQTLEMKGNLFDTHPSPKSRMRNACLENTEGIFQLEKPASLLFQEFDSLCELTSREMYDLLLAQFAAAD